MQTDKAPGKKGYALPQKLTNTMAFAALGVQKLRGKHINAGAASFLELGSRGGHYCCYVVLWCVAGRSDGLDGIYLCWRCRGGLARPTASEPARLRGAVAHNGCGSRSMVAWPEMAKFRPGQAIRPLTGVSILHVSASTHTRYHANPLVPFQIGPCSLDIVVINKI